MEQLDLLDYVAFSDILSDAKSIIQTTVNFYNVLSPKFGVILLIPAIIVVTKSIINIMMSVLTIRKFNKY